MADCLVHRGPDDAGVWVDEVAGIALGHRRLSILDLSPAGHQPMVSRSGRYVLVLNGECYNHAELRANLEGCGAEWRGHSDTETLLAAFERWGVGPTLRRTVGMFAIALWDRRERTLTLARDRIGEKPLFYGWHGDTLLFGSELKALRAHPRFCGEVDRDAAAAFLRHGYIPAPHSVYRGTRKLIPGTYVHFTPRDRWGGLPEPVVYWSLREAVERGAGQPFVGSGREAVDELEARLSEAVGLQRVADVPLGAFLSGGIDSSTVVALMQAHSTVPVKTFTIGFHEAAFNEAEHAKAVANHLGTEHTEFYVTPEEALSVIPKLPTLYDEPFGDASAIPTYLVSKLARGQVAVSLSGDGGDELFFGYGRYLRTVAMCRRVGRIPAPVRRTAPLALGAARRAALGLMGPLPGQRTRLLHFERKAQRAMEVMRADSTALIYRSFVSHWHDATSVVPGAREAETPYNRPDAIPAGASTERALMYLDAVSLLPDALLTKVDRAAMGMSLETRTPFLDHRVVEFAQSLPMAHLYRNGKGKAVLRDVLERYVPRELFERPKQGFGIPISQWMRGPLRGWAEALLDPQQLREDGIFEERVVTRRWREYLSGGANWEYQIWDVLMFQAWLRSGSALPSHG